MSSDFESQGRVFKDRRSAGRELGDWLAQNRPRGDLLVLGLPRGGVPVAYEVAQRLKAPLDVFLVRKLGAPFNPEYAVGAIASGDVVVYNEEALLGLGIGESELEPIIERERAELERRDRLYRGGRTLAVAGKTTILVDDGIATGSTMRAAVEAVKKLQAARVVVAAPNASREAVAVLEDLADVVAVLSVPGLYVAVGAHYEHFPQVEDEEVVALLSAHDQQRAAKVAQ